VLRVWVPATSANLGPALDAAALALNLWNRFDITPAASWRLSMEGPEAGTLDAEDNPLRTAVEWLAASLGRSTSPWAVHISSAVPMARGLGSSATAVVAGLMAANAMWGLGAGVEDLVDWATLQEGHPDNVAAAIRGGLVVAWRAAGRTESAAVPIPEHWRAVVAWPATELSTRRSRAPLPATVTREDAVHNLTRAALLLTGLALDREEWVAASGEDRLHEPYRAHLIPAFAALKSRAREAGAVTVVLSGAGPAVLALAPVDRAAAVARAMSEAYREAAVTGAVRVLDIARAGARLEEVSRQAAE
jgi:homoserine kinase